MTSVVIRGLGGIVTGWLPSPTRPAGDLFVRDGRIADRADSDGADVVIEAGGRWAVPGLVDGAFGLYFGDHEPTFSARGAIAAAVGNGTTTLVASGLPRLPGPVTSPLGRRELAILTMRSWIHDRPRSVRVVAGLITADPAWSDTDLADLASGGAIGIDVDIDAAEGDIVSLARRVREAGLGVSATLRTAPSASAGVGNLERTIAAVDPAAVLLVGSAAIDPTVAEMILRSSEARLGVTLAAGLEAVVAAVARANTAGALNRLFLGTGLPGRGGVLPGGMALLVDGVVASGAVDRATALALASARNPLIEDGPAGIRPGGAADLSLLDASPDGLGPLSAWTDPPTLVMIGGEIVAARANLVA